MLTQREMREHKAKLRKIERAGERKQLKDELRAKREEYWPPKKWPSTSKMALAYIFISCTAVQIYSMVAMWHLGDLSALHSLIGATIAEGIAFCSYEAKSTRENTKGGIVHDIAIKAKDKAQAGSDSASGEAKG